MILFMSILKAAQDRQRGAAMPEYGLLVALIAVAALIAVTALGTAVSDAFTAIADAITAALP